MSPADIERITLRIAGFGPDSGDRLARRVANGLSAWRPPPDLVRPADRLRVPVTHNGSETPDELADRIVATLIRELEGTS